MNIKIANRLVELRKKNGLSQEQLAEQLGLSRQAVSKWERAEASPDTDNLICLAKIYGISLDELLADDESIDDIRRNVKEQQKEKGFEFNGEDCEVHISNDGIHVKDDDGNTVHITSKDGIVVTSKDGEEKKPKNVVLGAISGLTIFAVVISYLIIGFTVPFGFANFWPLFLLIAIVPTFVEAIQKRKFTHFAYPVLVTCVYCFLGMLLGLWHPYWVLFLTIPVYYIIFDPIDKLIHKEEKND